MVIMFDNKLDIKSFEQFSISIEDGLSKTNENDKKIISINNNCVFFML